VGQLLWYHSDTGVTGRTSERIVWVDKQLLWAWEGGVGTLTGLGMKKGDSYGRRKPAARESCQQRVTHPKQSHVMHYF